MPSKQTSTGLGCLLKTAGIVVLCVLSGVAGAVLIEVTKAHPDSLSYADFVSILLTAISTLMTVLAIFLAVAGFVGWTTIEQKVHAKTQDFLANGFTKGGPLDQMVTKTIERKTAEIMYQGVAPVGTAEWDEDASGETASDGER